MTTRSRVAVVLGLGGLGVAVAQALLLSSPPTWFQIAVVVFWSVVGAAYLASGLGQRWRDRLRPRRHRVPDGELSTGGPGGDVDVVRRDDVGDGQRDVAVPVGGDGADVGPGEATAVVPPIAATPVRAARARSGAHAAGAVVPVRPGPAATSHRRARAPVAAGRPAPPSSSPAPVPVPPPTAAETTAARVSPWPLVATSVPPAAPAPTTPAPPAPAPDPAAAAADETDVTPGPTTSPSFAIRPAAPHLSFGRRLRRPAAHRSGRHAVPDEQVADEMAPRRHRHRRPTDTLEQPAVEVPPPARRHRASRRRAG